MATLLLHKELSKDKKEYIVGCLAIAGDKRNTIVEKFPIEDFEENLFSKWDWLNKDKNIIYWSDTTQNLDENLSAGIEIIKNLVLEESTKSNELPKYIKYTISDIKRDLFEKTKSEPTTLQLQLATTLVLMEIASYFTDNVEDVFDFPLYEAYLKKHNLSKEDYEVFDMLEDISAATMILI